MFETNTVVGFSTTQEQQSFGSQSTFADSPVAYGLDAKQENLIASSFTDIHEIDVHSQEGFHSPFLSFN